ncbi:GNAT family N-acetyltransferase [Cognaticolwellia mytili]|uniref:GNAT family N-acetyltransferase n=1 Tax=Cognaticolwellia mytili TaxID=1888913 RepID=UPI000A177F31|nr:GNAT family N-acetyltransferase [Cognaticolwellia mytili]
MKVIYSFTDKYIEQVYWLHKQAWWSSGRTVEETKRCLEGSQVCIGILDEDENLIAFTRVITDFIFKAIIFDVIVDKSHQGAGLGQRLMSLVKQHKDLHSVKHFELYCLPEMVAFYESFGFSTDIDGISLMRCVNS